MTRFGWKKSIFTDVTLVYQDDRGMEERDERVFLLMSLWRIKTTGRIEEGGERGSKWCGVRQRRLRKFGGLQRWGGAEGLVL